MYGNECLEFENFHFSAFFFFTILYILSQLGEKYAYFLPIGEKYAFSPSEKYTPLCQLSVYLYISLSLIVLYLSSISPRGIKN